jgi:hypothetical protein
VAALKRSSLAPSAGKELPFAVGLCVDIVNALSAKAHEALRGQPWHATVQALLSELGPLVTTVAAVFREAGWASLLEEKRAADCYRLLNDDVAPALKKLSQEGPGTVPNVLLRQLAHW